MLPSALLSTGVLLLTVPLLRSLPSSIRKGRLLAGSLHIAGALALEVVEGRIEADGGQGTLAMLMLIIFEEPLEMSGVILFIRVLLFHLSRNSLKHTVSCSGTSQTLPAP